MKILHFQNTKILLVSSLCVKLHAYKTFYKNSCHFYLTLIIMINAGSMVMQGSCKIPEGCIQGSIVGHSSSHNSQFCMIYNIIEQIKSIVLGKFYVLKLTKILRQIFQQKRSNPFYHKLDFTVKHKLS